MAAKPDIVSYLKENLKNFPVDKLRQQLAEEGVSEADFEEALQAARAAAPKRQIKARAGQAFILAGVGAVCAAALISLRKPAEPPAREKAGGPVAPGESAFVGAYGYVMRLPAGYTAVQSFKDQARTVEVVHFCKAGTDPTHFLNEGLYGQLGIVRLEVQNSAFAGNLNGLEALTRLLTLRSQQRGEKFTLKNLQVSSLRGIQLNFDAPFPRVEAYILGQKALYSFMAGEDDEVFRELLRSLRDAHTEI